MENFDLNDLHFSFRYKLNVDCLVNELYKIYNDLRKSTRGVDEAQKICGELFHFILKKFDNLTPYLDDVKSLKDSSKKTSFTSLLSGTNLNKDSLELLDFLAFRIVDFYKVFGNEKHKDFIEKKQFSNRSFRTPPQMFFKQQGQLWILNCLQNILQFIKECQSIEENKIITKENAKEDLEKLKILTIIRKIVDEDFCPYPIKIKNSDITLNDKKIWNENEEFFPYSIERSINDKIVKEKILEMKLKYLNMEILNKKLINVKKEDRLMGFELEFQLYIDEADDICENEKKYGKHKGHKARGSKSLLSKIYNKFKESNSITLKEVKLLTDSKEDIKKYGNLSRDVTNVRYKQHGACEYSSPANSLQNIKINAKELCDFLKESGGGLIRQDAGAHVHISIEDLKNNQYDSSDIKKAKLQSLKRILKNFILSREEFESVIPECRRGDNSMFSGQTYESCLNGDTELVISLITACNSYEEIQSVLSITPPIFSLRCRENTFEFRSFPGTTNYEVFEKWFELLNEFVDNSIQNLARENCINKKLLNDLQILTKNGEYIYGMNDDDTQNISFKCNSIDYSKFKTIDSSALKKSTNLLLSKQAKIYKLYDDIAEYIQSTNITDNEMYFDIPPLNCSSVAINFYRKPGEHLNYSAKFYKQLILRKDSKYKIYGEITR